MGTKQTKRGTKLYKVAFELVDAADGCPKCGNIIMDRLVWEDEAELVHCLDCQTVYDPWERKIVETAGA